MEAHIKKDKHVFIVRSDNDFDHALPLINLIIKNLSPHNKILLISRDPLRSYANDVRIRLLNTENLDYVDSMIIMSNRISGLIITTLRQTYFAVQGILIPSKLLLLLKPVISNVLLSTISKFRNKSDRKLFTYMSALRDIRTLSIDTGLDTFNRRTLKDLNNEGLKKIVFNHSIPHVNLSLMHCMNLDETITKKNLVTPQDIYTIVPNRFVYDSMVSDGYKSETIILGGSPRFQQDWVNKLASSAPKRSKHNRLKVLVVASKMQEHINKKEIFFILSSIINSDRFDLLIKPHTRLGRTGLPYYIESKARMCYNESTNDLVEESDIIMFWSTSFIYHAVQRNKPIVFLKYVYSLPFHFNNILGVGWEINSRNDLHEKMNQLYLDFKEGFDPSTRFQYQVLLKEMNPDNRNEILKLYE